MSNFLPQERPYSGSKEERENLQKRLDFNVKASDKILQMADATDADMERLDRINNENERILDRLNRPGPQMADGGHGQQTKVFESDDQAKAFVHLLQAAGGSREAENRFEDLMGQSIHSGHYSGDNASGGYLVPETLSRSLIHLQRRYGAYRRGATVLPLAHGSITVPKVETGVTTFYVDENAAATPSVGAFKGLRLDLKKLVGLAVMSLELAEDAVINVADRLAQQFARDLAKQEDQAGFFGDASAAYGSITGICTHLDDSATAGNDVRVQAANWAAFGINDLVTVMSKTAADADDNSAWYCSKAFFAAVLLRVACAAGGVTLNEMQNRVRPYILGYPVEFSDSFPRATAGGQTCCLFGDLSQAALMGVSRSGLQLAKSDSAVVGGVSMFESSMQAIRLISRWDANNHSYGQNGDASPVAILATS